MRHRGAVREIGDMRAKKIRTAGDHAGEIGDLGITTGDLEWLEWFRDEGRRNERTEIRERGTDERENGTSIAAWRFSRLLVTRPAALQLRLGPGTSSA